MRSDHRTGADAHPGTYDAEGPDADVGRELGLARDDRARIDHLEASGATIISACATSCAPTEAAVEERQIPLRVRCSCAGSISWSPGTARRRERALSMPTKKKRGFAAGGTLAGVKHR